jgi:hypothetical protein
MENSKGASALMDSFHSKPNGPNDNFAGNHSFIHEESV